MNMQKAVKARTEKVKVILDTNAFFVPLQFKIDIFEELAKLLNTNAEPILLSPVHAELKTLSKRTKTKKRALFALKLAEKCRIVDMGGCEGSSDEIIARTAGEWRCPVFTNDAVLRRKLRDINVPVIYVRQKSRLEIEGRL